MYYYAAIDSTNYICYEVYESEVPVTDDPYWIQIDSNDRSYIIRKKYIDGVWLDTLPSEVENIETRHVEFGDIWLDDKIYELEDEIDNHTHIDYASSDDLELLEDIVDTKANATHTHSEYAASSHSHDNYATVTSLDTLESEVNGKANANHTHTEYASISHTHNEYAATNHSHSNYAESTHNHDTDYADISHNHNSAYASAGHDHDEDYATIDHTHTNYATTTALNEVSSVVSGKANTSHTHNDIYYTETEIDTKLAGKSDSTHNHNNAYDAKGAAASALTSANSYTDSKIDALVGEGASTTLDTIGEISSAIEDNQDAIDLLNSAIGNKVNSSDLTSHTGNATIHVTSTDKNNWNVAKAHADSAHAPSNAEKNQNAFSNIAVGNTTISADVPTDTLTLVAGNNVTLTPNATGDSITIASTNTVYTHPTSAGNKHIPAGGSSGQILRWSADGTAVWGSDNNTTYSNATQTASGLMSNTDKTKLDGVADNANNYVLPSAGASLGGVKTGGDVTIASGVITVNDDSHNHVISNVDGLQSALDGKAANGHNHDGIYYTESEVDTLLSGKANSSHTHTIANVSGLQSALDGKASSSHGTHVSYSTTAPVMDGTASVGTASAVARSDHKHPTDTSRAAQASLDSHTSNKSNPHGVTLAQLGVTATATELNSLDGITATVTELNYVDGVTSSIQTQLNGKAASSHTHNYAGSSSAGGSANSANKLATARTISLTGDVTGSTSFDGSGNVSITATVADDSHNHTIANIDGLQTAINGKAATSHNHDSTYIKKSLQMTADDGDVTISWSNQDVVAKFKALGSGIHTAYAKAGTTNNPKTTESWRFMMHKTGATTYGWVMAYGSSGSVYTGYVDNGTWKGWKCLFDAAPEPLWSGGANGGYYMTATHTITPKKKLSECRNGWALLWSDYDVGDQANNTDFYMSYIYKRAYTGQVWGGGQWYCDVPSYSAGTATDSEQRIIKLLNIYDAKIVGTENNAAAPRNDVVLRAVYEF